MHEAFAEPGSQAAPVPLKAPKAPPQDLEEMPPADKPTGDNIQWIGGYWWWDDQRVDFLWVSGIWRAPPPDRQWEFGYWTELSPTEYQWTNGFWKPVDNGEIVVLPELPVDAATRKDEDIPTPPHKDAVYSPGTYVYQDDRYVWRTGSWIEPREGWVYIPAHYIHTPAGCIFVEAYWDREIEERGCLFAPVYVDYQRLPAEYTYTPQYVVHSESLLSSLWVRPGCNSYYFGDCYDSVWQKCGLQSCLDPSYRDPLLSHYRQHRGEAWHSRMNELHQARLTNESLRPPQTLRSQHDFIRQIKSSGGGNLSNLVNQKVMLAGLNQVNRRQMPLETLDRSKQTAFQRSAKEQHLHGRQQSQLIRNLRTSHAEQGGKVAMPSSLRQHQLQPKGGTNHGPLTGKSNHASFPGANGHGPGLGNKASGLGRASWFQMGGPNHSPSAGGTNHSPSTGSMNHTARWQGMHNPGPGKSSHVNSQAAHQSHPTQPRAGAVQNPGGNTSSMQHNVPKLSDLKGNGSNRSPHNHLPGSSNTHPLSSAVTNRASSSPHGPQNASRPGGLNSQPIQPIGGTKSNHNQNTFQPTGLNQNGFRLPGSSQSGLNNSRSVQPLGGTRSNTSQNAFPPTGLNQNGSPHRGSNPNGFGQNAFSQNNFSGNGMSRNGPTPSTNFQNQNVQRAGFSPNNLGANSFGQNGMGSSRLGQNGPGQSFGQSPGGNGPLGTPGGRGRR